jgi:hypothetical protein
MTSKNRQTFHRFINLEASGKGGKFNMLRPSNRPAWSMDIFLFNEDRSRAGKAYSWYAAGFQGRGEPGKDLFLDLFPKITAQLLKGRVIALPGLGDSRSLNGFEKGFLQSDRTESLIPDPHVAGKVPIGFLGFSP